MTVAAGTPKGPAQGPLEGEDIETEHWEDARHWMSIYDDLIRFKLGLLERQARTTQTPSCGPKSRQSGRYLHREPNDRLDLWYQRVWKLQGLWLDPNGRVLRHKGKEAVLTDREFELLQFLLDHPHRFYTSSQIMGYAWSDSALFPEEVRNYVSRVRKILARLEIPCDLVNRPGRGYSLKAD
jgi:DNA-binding response OmpR family regulator